MNRLQGLQMIGTQRCGSNLLRLMLNQHSQIFAPHPPHILQCFTELISGYGNLSNPNSISLLTEDIVNYIKINPVPWEFIPDTNSILNAIENNSLIEIVEQVYAQSAAHSGKNIWCCKSLQNVNYWEEIQNTIKDIKFLHIYRDGRDSAVSFQKAPVGEKHIYFIAKQWVADQQKAQNCKLNTNSTSFLSLSYELLMENPIRELNSICNFLGMEFENSMLEYFTSVDAVKTANSGKMWENVKQPLIKTNTHKFVSGLSEEEILIFESVAGNMLIELGYTLYFPEHSPIVFTEQQLAEFAMENEQRKKASLTTLNSEEREKRIAQKNYLDYIKTRNLAK